MEKAKITIIGAGIVGLAIAQELSRKYSDIVILEQHDSFGEETSSRNSEVIHAGIYYPQGSLKARMCVSGREMLYEYCRAAGIPFKKLGKLIVSSSADLPDLEALCANGRANGVKDLEIISAAEIKKLEPHINGEAALFSPSTGIVDARQLMNNFLQEALGRGTRALFCSRLIGLKKEKDRYELLIKNSGGDSSLLESRIVINAAGLGAENVARLAGIISSEYKLKYCKGDYFRVSPDKAKLISRLVYSLPRKQDVSLGIHTALDLIGGLRLGPDAEYVETIDYKVDEHKRHSFYEKVSWFLPFIEADDLSPDISGIRAKLQGPQEGFRDFIILEESACGYGGLINLIGIDSPGLTCCLSIAKEVAGIVRRIS